MLHEEKEKEFPKVELITNKDLLDNREFLLGLQNRKVSYISNVFIHRLLDIFENHLSKIEAKSSIFPEKYPQTTFLGPVKMVSSPQGKERWLEAVKKGTPFNYLKN